jgi:peptidyl-prolyl cis-trans isomerase B (cyclophilin B)
VRRGLTIVVLCAVAALSACGSDGGNKKTPATATAGGCKRVSVPQPQNRTAKEPTGRLDARKRYLLTFITNCGDFMVTLDPRLAPHTTTSLVSLARLNFFDGTAFHRIVPGYVIQGGDPSATGSGGPGYSTVDKPAATSTYTKGMVAMAKTGSEPAGTAGSQFFVVLEDAPQLPPDYAIVGRVSEGFATVDRIGRLGGADGRPTEPVVIQNVTVTES